MAQRKAIRYFSAWEIGAAQLRSVTEIAPPQPFLCVNRSTIRYDYRGGAKAIRYSGNIAFVSWSLITLRAEALRSARRVIAYWRWISIASQSQARPEVDVGWVSYKNKQTNKQTKAVLLSFRFPLSYETGSNIFFIKGDLIVNVNTCERLRKQQN